MTLVPPLRLVTAFLLQCPAFYNNTQYSVSLKDEASAHDLLIPAEHPQTTIYDVNLCSSLLISFQSEECWQSTQDSECLFSSLIATNQFQKSILIQKYSDERKPHPAEFDDPKNSNSYRIRQIAFVK
ncbi:hypothetical protein L1887_27607 [Cichorium endivia]|nr:hypothetical protein L1887_27607 [Cichorium endivia]